MSTARPIFLRCNVGGNSHGRQRIRWGGGETVVITGRLVSRGAAPSITAGSTCLLQLYQGEDTGTLYVNAAGTVDASEGTFSITIAPTYSNAPAYTYTGVLRILDPGGVTDILVAWRSKATIYETPDSAGIGYVGTTTPIKIEDLDINEVGRQNLDRLVWDSALERHKYVPADKHNVAAGTPTANDDASAGYTIGSLWFDTSVGVLLVCQDNTIGAAGWAFVSSATSGPGANSESGSPFREDLASMTAAIGRKLNGGAIDDANHATLGDVWTSDNPSGSHGSITLYSTMKFDWLFQGQDFTAIPFVLGLQASSTDANVCRYSYEIHQFDIQAGAWTNKLLVASATNQVAPQVGAFEEEVALATMTGNGADGLVKAVYTCKLTIDVAAGGILGPLYWKGLASGS